MEERYGTATANRAQEIIDEQYALYGPGGAYELLN